MSFVQTRNREAMKMTVEQILKVLKNERECIKRQGTEKCNRVDHPITGCKFCDLCLPDTEILEVYDFLINGYELLQDKNNVESYTIKIRKDNL